MTTLNFDCADKEQRSLLSDYVLPLFDKRRSFVFKFGEAGGGFRDIKQAVSNQSEIAVNLSEDQASRLLDKLQNDFRFVTRVIRLQFAMDLRPEPSKFCKKVAETLRDANKTFNSSDKISSSVSDNDL
ncbi:MAG: hypothetical protein JXR42_05850 [Gammaproteobacteria bacterium]|nr:hypothetical protein [Gammaproteobacteria bacterium]